MKIFFHQEINQYIKKIKNTNSYDVQGWSNKILKKGGKDLINSLNLLFNERDETKITPEEWEHMFIKSIYKGKNDKREMENRRGLFITSCINKLYEKVKLARNNQKFNDGISEYQCGGIKGKSTIDHIMTLNARLQQIYKL